MVSREQVEQTSREILAHTHSEREEKRNRGVRLRQRLASPIVPAGFAAYSMYMLMDFMDSPIKAMLLGAFVGWLAGATLYPRAESSPPDKTNAVSAGALGSLPRPIRGFLRLLRGACGIGITAIAFRWHDFFEGPLDRMPSMVAGAVSASCMLFGVYLLFFALTGDWLPRLTKRRRFGRRSLIDGSDSSSRLR